jgi:ABC-type multidrug transport system fused ATPase/permease subunit
MRIAEFRSEFVQSTLGRSFYVLAKKDRQKLFVVVIIQVFLGLLDLAGVAIFGILGALAVTGVGSRTPGNRISTFLETIGLSGFSLQWQVTILAFVAAGLLIGKTIFSVLFIRRTMFFLSRRGALISSLLVSKLLAQPLQVIQQRTMQQNLFAVTGGVGTITLGVLGTAVALISDISLLIIMMIGLFIVDPTIAISTLIVFGGIGYLLYRLMNVRARELGIRQSDLNIGSNERILEVLGSYRESVVRNRRNYYAMRIGKQRLELANNSAEMAFMPNISKYVIEITVLLGSLVISAMQFAFQDATHAVAVLSVFLAASTRIAPAVLRVQQGALQIRGSLGSASPTLELIEQIGIQDYLEEDEFGVELEHVGFAGDIQLADIQLTYPGNEQPAISGINLKISNGESVALVGPSGAGKTTLVDVLLGVLTPDCGTIRISGVEPLVAFARWQGAVSYVPQDVIISNATIRENVSLGYPVELAKDEIVWRALELAQLDEFVRELPSGLDTRVGDRGTKISGGQRQRLGIARAMFTQPKLLVLDEATSSLDSASESLVQEALENLMRNRTSIVIAHRLSTIRNADQIIVLDRGVVRETGTHDQLLQHVDGLYRHLHQLQMDID